MSKEFEQVDDKLQETLDDIVGPDPDPEVFSGFSVPVEPAAGWYRCTWYRACYYCKKTRHGPWFLIRCVA